MNLKKMLEVAGVTQHLEAEKKQFAAACEALETLCTFLQRHEGTDYREMCKNVKKLKDEMSAHLKTYDQK